MKRCSRGALGSRSHVHHQFIQSLEVSFEIAGQTKFPAPSYSPRRFCLLDLNIFPTVQIISYRIQQSQLSAAVPSRGGGGDDVLACYRTLRASVDHHIAPDKPRFKVRQTCKALEILVPLRLSRVFTSANPLDIKVFHAIADHAKLRKQVTEIVWDEARFTESADWFQREFKANQELLYY